MNQKSTMPIREFARLTGIRPANLRFYDQIGLLSPELRGGKRIPVLFQAAAEHRVSHQ